MTEPLTVTGVPASITRAQCVALIESLGLDPNGLNHLELYLEGIDAVVLARNSEGEPYLIEGEFATHRISIPIKD